MWTMIQFLDSLINLRGKWNQERKYIHGVMNRHKVKGKQFCSKMILVPWRKLSSPKQWAYTFSRRSAYTYSSRFFKNIRGHRCFSYKKEIIYERREIVRHIMNVSFVFPCPHKLNVGTDLKTKLIRGHSNIICWRIYLNSIPINIRDIHIFF